MFFYYSKNGQAHTISDVCLPIFMSLYFTFAFFDAL